METFFHRPQTINCKGKLLDISSPVVMAIVNVNDDSFYARSRVSEHTVINHVEKALTEGASIIDIGAISSRPGADLLDYNTEQERLKPILHILQKTFPDTCFSLDTFRSDIAQWAVETYGIAMINDISAGSLDKAMFDTIAKLQVPYCLMHMQGTPETMQQSPHYDNVVQDIIQYFVPKVKKLQRLGVNDIILDPGFGFGKTIQHNYELLAHLDDFKLFELPILVGISRKSMIYKTLNISPEEALNGTTALHTIALLNGANILRVHDVKAAMEVIRLVETLKPYLTTL